MSKKYSGIVDEFLRSEFRGHDVARTVRVEREVLDSNAVADDRVDDRMDSTMRRRTLYFGLSEKAPLNVGGISPFLPRGWKAEIALYSEENAATHMTMTTPMLWIVVPSSAYERHPMWSEVYYAAALVLAVAALAATFVYRFLYIY